MIRFVQRLCTLLLMVGLVAAPTLSRAQDVSADAELESVKQHLMMARYDEAIDASQHFLSRRDLDASHRNAGLEALAIAEIATNASDDATRTLSLLFRRDPAYRLSDSDASPPVQSAFARAHDARTDTIHIEIASVPPTMTVRETPVIEARIVHGIDAVEEMRLSYRFAQDPAFTRVTMALTAGVAHVRLPLGSNDHIPDRIEYFIEALAPSRTTLTSLGNENAPLELFVPAAAVEVPLVPEETGTVTDWNPPTRNNAGLDSESAFHASTSHDANASPSGTSTKITKKWWFWTLIGVAVVGAAAGTYAAVSSHASEAPMGSLGTLTLHN